MTKKTVSPEEQAAMIAKRDDMMRRINEGYDDATCGRQINEERLGDGAYVQGVREGLNARVKWATSERDEFILMLKELRKQ